MAEKNKFKRKKNLATAYVVSIAMNIGQNINHQVKN